jgi:glycosyltransferase involved in cell wall biosynthesis
MKLPVTIIVRTLNEENNIQACVKTCKNNNVDEIIVVDGGSVDQTVALAQKESVSIIKSEKGLVKQRDTGLKYANSDNQYIAIVDADDRLEKYCIRHLISDLMRDKAHAVQAKHESYAIFSKKPLNYWEEAMLVNLKIINEESKKQSSINMIGRPALYNRQRLMEAIKLDSNKFTTASEDADLSYQLLKNGARFTYGTGLTYRKHLNSFFKLYKRWLSYGSGDAKFIITHKDRLFHVIYHLLINYPIIRSFKSIKTYSIRYVPFFLCQGLIRFIGLLKFFITGIGKSDDYKV